MTDAFTLIRTLGKEGKSPKEIALELYSRGVRGDNGKTLSAEAVLGFLRFIGNDSTAGHLPGMFGPIEAVWGARKEINTAINGAGVLAVKKLRNNRPHPGRVLSDELKAQVAKLYHREGKNVYEIAAEIGCHPRKIGSFCAMLAGLDVPPGEVTVFLDKDGREITQCPPAFAHGAYPQRNVGVKGGW